MQQIRNKPRGKPQQEEQTGKRRISIIQFIERTLSLHKLPEEGLPLQILPIFIFVFSLLMGYIANNHYANKNNMKITKIKKQVDELRVDYTDLKAAYMSDSKQSSIAERVLPYGLEESKNPPSKIKKQEEE